MKPQSTAPKTGATPAYRECPTCRFLSGKPGFVDGSQRCPVCGSLPPDGSGPRRVFPTERLQRLDSRIRRYHEDGEHEIVVILVAAFLEAILEDMIDRLLTVHGADLQVRKAVLDGQRAIGGRIGRLVPQLTGEEFEDIAAELGFRDFPKRWRDMREQRNAFIHDTPFRDAQESLDRKTAEQAMRLLDQAYLLFVLMNNRFIAKPTGAA